jgi:hypothetical protein
MRTSTGTGTSSEERLRLDRNGHDDEKRLREGPLLFWCDGDVMVLQFYAGVGSRETPPEVLDRMEQYGRWLRTGGFILRSGRAQGADQAFERGADSRSEIYLPWEDFEKDAAVSPHTYVTGSDEELDVYVDKFHPHPEYLKPGARKLMRRNTNQVLGRFPGRSLPSLFVLCWTKDGSPGGGTGQAMRIASEYGIRIFNLHNPDADEELLQFLRTL